MSFANPAGLLLLALAIPVVALHMLKPRRRSAEVSSTLLWEAVATPVSAATPWQPLRRSLLLALQLLAVALLALAAAQPVTRAPGGLAEHTVFVIDTSGSMAARDGSPDRLAEAIDEAKALRGELPAGGIASIVEAGIRPRVVLTGSADRGDFDAALAGLEASAGTPDFPAAFTLAASLETADAGIGFVLVSDGGVPDGARSAIPPGTRYLDVGEASTNRAIERLTLEPRGTGLHARVTVTNTGGPSATQRLRIDLDGRTVEERALELAPGESVDLEVDLPAGEKVEAFLESEDLLGADDHARAVAPQRRELKVLIAGPVDPFVTELIGAMDGVTVETTEESRTAEGFDLAIYNGVAVPEDPGSPVLAIAPPGGLPAGGITASGTVEEPVITLVRADDPLLDGLDLSDVSVGEAQQVEAPTAPVLVGAEGAPLLLRTTVGGRPAAYLAFSLKDSTLPIQVAWPVLADRLVADLAGAAVPPTALEVGARLPVPAGVETKIVDPAGRRTPVAPGSVAPVADRPGFWTIETEGRPAVVVAVNASPSESRLQPESSLPIEVLPEGERGVAPDVHTSRLAWLLVPLGAVLLGELLVARRRVGVSSRQWRISVAVRVLVAVLVVGALVAPTVTRRADRVATVFVLDASDSMGGAGRAAVIDWAADAIAGQPDDALSGVVLFGADARIDLTVDERERLGQPSVAIDATGTDLEAALRLGAAVLPTDAKRRVVVVSDGRATTGDAAAEAQALRDAGVVVEVHTVQPREGPDVAVRFIDLPARSTEGIALEVTAVVDAAKAGPATLVLERDGEPVGEQTVDLVKGENRVTFTDTPEGGGLHRYRVQVRSSSDSVPQNDVGYGAVEVTGPPKVLVAEGIEGEASALADALEAGGLQADVVLARDLPPLDELATYAGVVLVDVDALSLSADQVAALHAVVRDQGRGLVTVGGVHSYGLGSYLNSPLEDILPVISEITDPKRRKTVAEVLAIDTSGSMGACHSASGGIPSNRSEGGVSKTDIARTAAARSIEALSENDEVGVLAFDTSEEWVIDLQKLPSDQIVNEGLRGIHPSGGTNLSHSLAASAAALRESKASLKHIILFTDGFTSTDSMSVLADEAAALKAEGITVSVVATGEGAAEALRPIAESGGGRFYPGEDLEEIPQIMVQETVIASRDFINEGEFLPEVTSNSAPVRNLDASPPLLGYVATTAKDTSTVMLRIGEDRDPLLASWQLGLGRVTSWTSDASDPWSQQWAAWEGYSGFWTGVVKDTFAASSAGGGVRARVVDGVLNVTVEAEAPWPDGATATARVTDPDLQGRDVPLERIDATTFAGEVPALGAGTYAVGAQVTAPDGTTFSGAALANRSYSAEYEPGDAEPEVLAELSSITAGRGEITPTQAFDDEGLVSGRSHVTLAGWMLLLAALLWPVAVGLSRLAVRGSPVGTLTTVVGGGAGRASGWVRAHLPTPPGRAAASARPAPARRGTAPPGVDPAPTPAGPPVAPTATTPAPPATVGRLLERKRAGRGETPPSAD